MHHFSALKTSPEYEVPKHVAFIVDGNGRWAIKQGESSGLSIDRTYGHTVGANVTVNIVKRTFALGVDYVTLFLFSTENWTRPKPEIENILGLLNKYLFECANYFQQDKIELKVIGQKHRLPEYTQRLIESVGYKPSSDTNPAERRQVLCLALSYGGRDDIVESCRAITQIALQNQLQQLKNKSTTSEDYSDSKAFSNINIDQSLFSQHTQLGKLGIPDPDLIIRTSGEFRLSNFLLWNSAYSEFEAVSCNWPEFTPDMAEDIILRFHDRKRRFGGISSTI